MADSVFVSSLSLETDGGEKRGEDEREGLLERRAAIEGEMEELDGKIAALRAEKEEISKRLTALGYPEALPPLKRGKPTVTKQSSGDEKASFLYDLFQGRRDVFPMRVLSKKTGKINYYPQCKNLFGPTCPRGDGSGRKVSCTECAHQNFIPVTPALIYTHQIINKSKDELGAIGIYVLREDNTCFFVVIDMDEKSYLEDARAVLTVARNSGFSMCVERSRSGGGVHLWIFFSCPIEARYARRLAFSFLREAAEDGNIKARLASYDRIFPTQDALTENGFGNLILMPLVRSAAGRKCTIFLEDDLESAYPDQLEYLSSVKRHSKEEVLSYLKGRSGGKEDTFSLSAEEEPDMPWKRALPDISQEDFKKPLVLYLSAGITLDKSALSHRAIYYFIKLASFSNPEYYKRVARSGGYVNRSIPSTIYTHEETESALLLPRAFLPFITSLLRQRNIPFRIEDHRTRNTGLDAVFRGKLKPEQVEWYHKLLERESGILKAATSFGKTVIAIALIAAKKERTLILVEKSDLVGQWKRKLEELLTVRNEVVKRKYKRDDGSPFGTLEGARDNLKGLVDIMMMQSLHARLRNHTMPEGFLNSYGMVIVDECHHLAAYTFCSLAKDLPAATIFGLTATEKREDGREKIIYAHIGKVLEAADAATLERGRNIAQHFIPHFLGTSLAADPSGMKWNEFLDLIAKNEERNRAILDDVEAVWKRGRHILLVTKRTDHVDYLTSRLKERGVDALSLYGKMKRNDREDVMRRIREEEGRNNTVLVATSSFMEEGTDIPHLDTLFITLPLASERGIIQIAGRIGRDAEGKRDTLIHDYVDIGIPPSEATYHKRVRIYGKLGYLPGGRAEIPEEETLFTSENAIEEIEGAVERARESIIISVPFIIPTESTERIFSLLREREDVAITIVTGRRKTDGKYGAIKRKVDEFLAGLAHLSFHETDESAPTMLLIDRDELWYGDLNYLSLSDGRVGAKGTLMRIRSRKLVERMMALPLFRQGEKKGEVSLPSGREDATLFPELL